MSVKDKVVKRTLVYTVLNNHDDKLHRLITHIGICTYNIEYSSHDMRLAN